MVSTVDTFTFNLSDVIGKSNYGKVYRGYSLRTQEVVAVKEIPKKYLEHQFYNTVFNNEVSALRKIQSPHVVKYIDLKIHNDKYYLIMEYCDGGDLGELLTKRRRFPEPEFMVLMNDIVEGMKEMKRVNVLHRDLKPANILMKNGKIKIADLGYSKPVRDYTNELFTSYVGSPLYMSPQILFKQTYTTKADIWSLGVILFQLITGEAPWDSSDIPRLQASVANRTYRFPPHIPVSVDIKDLIIRCLAYEECDRISWDELFNHPAVLRAKPQAPLLHASIMNASIVNSSVLNGSVLNKSFTNSFALQPRMSSLQAFNTPQAKHVASSIIGSPAIKVPQMSTFSTAVTQANTIPRQSVTSIQFSPASSIVTPLGTPQKQPPKQPIQRQLSYALPRACPMTPVQNRGLAYNNLSPVIGGGFGGFNRYGL